MPAVRLMPTQESADLIELTRSIADKELRPLVDEAERAHAFPREVFTTLGRAGLLSLPYPEEYGGGGQPYEVYLQVLEEIAAAWAAVGVGTSVHALSCFGLFHAGTEEQKRRWLPDMLGGELLGAYCLSEAHAGSDPAAMRTRAVRDGRRLRDHRGEGLDHPRRGGRLLQGDGPHQRRRRARHLLLPGARRYPRPVRGHAGGQDGPDELGDRDDAVRQRAGARASGGWATRGRACRSRWPGWTPGASASPRSPPASPRRRWTWP